MEQIVTTLIVGLLGGSVAKTLVDRYFDRPKNAQSIHLTQEDQTLKWSEKALAVAEELMQVKIKLGETIVALSECEERCTQCKKWG
tara:strand:- start:45 stop:302 length:258 start_codon:yes stop_codon:yes gene_type:complete